MKLEEQVTSLELAKKLKEIGVKQESYFMWVGEKVWNPTEASDYETRSTPPRSEWISAFTVAELGEMLPDHWILTYDHVDGWVIHLSTISQDGGVRNPNKTGFQWEDNGANAMAKMLIYLIENELLSILKDDE